MLLAHIDHPMKRPGVNKRELEDGKNQDPTTDGPIHARYDVERIRRQEYIIGCVSCDQWV